MDCHFVTGPRKFDTSTSNSDTHTQKDLLMITKSETTIRLATASDLPHVYVANTGLLRGTGRLDKFDVATIAEGCTVALNADGLERYILAIIGERVAGQVKTAPRWNDFHNSSVWEIQRVFTHPDFRNHGVFSELLRTVEDRAVRCEVPGLYLHVAFGNEGAKDVYERRGFRAVGYWMEKSLL